MLSSKDYHQRNWSTRNAEITKPEMTKWQKNFETQRVGWGLASYKDHIENFITYRVHSQVISLSLFTNKQNEKRMKWLKSWQSVFCHNDCARERTGRKTRKVWGWTGGLGLPVKEITLLRLLVWESSTASSCLEMKTAAPQCSRGEKTAEPEPLPNVAWKKTKQKNWVQWWIVPFREWGFFFFF